MKKNKEEKKVKRLFYMSIVMVLLLSITIGIGAQSKPFEGKVLNISTCDGLPLNLLKLVTPAFEEETGAKVLFDSAWFYDCHAKAMINLAGGTGTYDLVLWFNEWAGSIYPYLEPLDEYIAKDDPGITDFVPNIADFLKQDGHWYALPYRMYVHALAYRKDIFEKNGITKIETMSDFRNVAKKLTQDTTGDGKIDTWGLVLSGNPGMIPTYSVPYLWSFGADFFDDNWKPLTNSKEFVQALEFYVSLFDYAVPGSKTFSDDEMLTVMQQGKAAMVIMGSPYIMKMQDKNQSQFWDKISVLPIPIEVPGSKPSLSIVMGHGIPRDSKNKELAYLYLKHLVKTESSRAMSVMGGNLPARMSVFEDPAMDEVIPGFSSYGKAFLTGRGTFVLPEGREILSIYGEEVSNAVSGIKTVKQATADMTERILKIMQEGEYYN